MIFLLYSNRFGLKFGKAIRPDRKKRGFFDSLEESEDVSFIPGGSVCNSIRVTNVENIELFSSLKVDAKQIKRIQMCSVRMHWK